MILQELFRDNNEVLTLDQDGRLSDAAELMRQYKIGSIVVMKKDEIVGIITDRDIGLSLALGAATPESFVGEVMTTEVETIVDSMNLFDVTRFFRTANVKRLPVVDRDGRLVGIISLDDIMPVLARAMFDTCSALEPKLGHGV